jgi:chemosensory pili system protein ChpA (sensor histidine kinase/response regulator)
VIDLDMPIDLEGVFPDPEATDATQEGRAWAEAGSVPEPAREAADLVAAERAAPNGVVDAPSGIEVDFDIGGSVATANDVEATQPLDLEIEATQPLDLEIEAPHAIGADPAVSRPLDLDVDGMADGVLDIAFGAEDLDAAPVHAAGAPAREVYMQSTPEPTHGDAGQAAAGQAAPVQVAEPAENHAAALAAGAASTAALEPVQSISPSADAEALSTAELRARGFDPAERLLERIQDEIDSQLLPIFLEEAAELVPLLGQQLRVWSQLPGDARNSQGLQRTLHTLKGSARMAGAMAIGQVTHSMEARVEGALDSQAIPSAIFDGLVASYDRVNALLDGLRGGAHGAPPDSVSAGIAADPADLREARAQASTPPPAVAASLVAVSDDDAAPAQGPSADAPAAARHAPQVAAPVAASASPEAVQRALLRVRADLVDRLVNEAGEVAIARSRHEGEIRGR